MRLVWPERPLAKLPRWAAIAALVATLVACIWSVTTLETRNTAHEADVAERLDKGSRLDMDLYRAVNARVAKGESYYDAALAEHRSFGFPTRPFVTVRTPVLAWTTALWGAEGWRTLALMLWGANILAWFAALEGMASKPERIGAGLLAATFGMIAFMKDIPYSHEALAGLLLSLALALSQRKAWAAGLALAVFGIALRELALPFLAAWAALTFLDGRRREGMAVTGAIALLVVALALHAAAVAQGQLPGDETSPGWVGLLGPGLALYGISITTLLQLLPNWLAGPLAVLPLLGWLGCGGRLGALASLWFAGFILAVSLFARQENFYWMGLFVPAYGVGLAFLPRALADLAASVRRT